MANIAKIRIIARLFSYVRRFKIIYICKHIFRMIFESALISIILILELSVFNESCLEFNFQANRTMSRVPCTAVFLRFVTLVYNICSFYFTLHM